MGVGTRAVYLDRDGTLIEDLGYPREPERVSLLAGVPEALRQLRAAGFRLVVVGNQSGVGRGIITEGEARAVHARFLEILQDEGIVLDAVKYCPHAPWDECDCRKPQAGMLISAADELGLDLGASFMVGDKCDDAEAGRRAGCTSILFAPGGAECEQADHVARDWDDVTRFIVGVGAAR